MRRLHRSLTSAIERRAAQRAPISQSGTSFSTDRPATFEGLPETFADTLGGFPTDTEPTPDRETP